MPEMPPGFLPGVPKVVKQFDNHEQDDDSESEEQFEEEFESDDEFELEENMDERDSSPSTNVKQQAAKVMGYVHPIAVVALVGVSFVAGYMYGWWLFGTDGKIGVGLLIAIVFAVGIRWPIKAWYSWAANRQLNEDTVAKELEKELRAEKGSRGINLEDFDVAAQSILRKAVKTAKKQKAKVSVPQLLSELANNIR